MSVDSSFADHYPERVDLCSIAPRVDLAAVAAGQGVRPVEEADVAPGDFWPEDESIEDFLSYLRAKRREET